MGAASMHFLTEDTVQHTKSFEITETQLHHLTRKPLHKKPQAILNSPQRSLDESVPHSLQAQRWTHCSLTSDAVAALVAEPVAPVVAPAAAAHDAAAPAACRGQRCRCCRWPHANRQVRRAATAPCDAPARLASGFARGAGGTGTSAAACCSAAAPCRCGPPPTAVDAGAADVAAPGDDAGARAAPAVPAAPVAVGAPVAGALSASVAAVVEGGAVAVGAAAVASATAGRVGSTDWRCAARGDMPEVDGVEH